VDVPEEPPKLTPEAALTLFEVLVKARAGRQEGDCEMTGHTIGDPVAGREE